MSHSFERQARTEVLYNNKSQSHVFMFAGSMLLDSVWVARRKDPVLERSNVILHKLHFFAKISIYYE